MSDDPSVEDSQFEGLDDGQLARARFKWEREQSKRAQARDTARFELEQKRAKWDTSRWLRFGLPLAGVLITSAQLSTAVSEHILRRSHEKLERSLAEERRQRERAIESAEHERLLREKENQGAQFADLVFRHYERFHAQDPIVQCKAVRIARLSPAADRMIGALGINVSICDNPADLERIVASRELDPLREGAQPGFVRRSFATKELLQESCQVPTENRHGREDAIATGTCSLSGAPEGAQIYQVAYACTEPRCGWSYNPDPSKGYQVDATISSPRSIQWRRRWDGDAATETYIMYYQLPDSQARR